MTNSEKLQRLACDPESLAKKAARFTDWQLDTGIRQFQRESRRVYRENDFRPSWGADALWEAADILRIEAELRSVAAAEAASARKSAR